MNARFTKVLMLFGVVGLFASTNTMAQSYLDGSSKMRGDYGQMSRPVYRQAAPMIAERNAAGTPRNFSYEPSQAAPVNGGCGCGAAPSAPTAAPAPIAQGPTQTYRAYSYEPSGRANSAIGSQTPLYLVPKSQR
jgi:hypothetical protein